MFPLGVLLCLLFLHQKGAALVDFYTHSAKMGSNTSIPCRFDVSAVASAQRTFSILWYFQEKEIFRYPIDLMVPSSRLSIDQDRINYGIADLYMPGVSIADGGLYKCVMFHPPEKKEKEIRLDVHAPPRITIANKNVVITEKSVLSCAVSEYYPVDIDIKWLRDGILLNNMTVGKPLRNPDGTYSVRSSVTIIPTKEDRERIFSCRVQHESLTTPHHEDFQLVYGDRDITLLAIIIGVIVGVLLIISLVAVIICYKRKANKASNQESQQETLMPANQGSTYGDEDQIKNSPRDSGYLMSELKGQQKEDISTHKKSDIESECSGVSVAAKIQSYEKTQEKADGECNVKRNRDGGEGHTRTPKPGTCVNRTHLPPPVTQQGPLQEGHKEPRTMDRTNAPSKLSRHRPQSTLKSF